MNLLPSCTAQTLRHRLSNGLTILVQPYRAAPVAALVTHVRTGYFDEPDELVGISHVLEHMYFKGTAHRGVGEIARDTKRAGGYVNAATSYDQTQYYTVVPAQSIARAIEIQSDAFLHAAIDADELTRELEVIIQEANRKLDSPPAVTVETLYETLFDHHRMRRWRIGTEQGLRSLSREAVIRFYRSRYVPRNTIVSVVGDVDPDRVFTHLDQTYGGAADVAPTRNESPREPDGRPGFRHRVLRGDVQQMTAALGWRTFGHADPRTPSLDLLAWVMAVGRGSWAFQNLRANNVARTVTASHYTPSDVGVFQLTAETRRAGMMDALRGLMGLVMHERAHMVTQADVDRARSLIGTHYAHRFEAVEGRATALAMFEAMGAYEDLDAYLEALLTRGPDEIHSAAERMTLDHAGLVAYVPEDCTGAFPDDLEAVLKQGMSIHTAAPPAPVTPRPPSSYLTHRRVHEIVTSTGRAIDIVTLRRVGVPTVSVSAVTCMGTRSEAREDAGLNLLTHRSALCGAGSLNREALALAAERLGGSLRVIAGADWSGWQTSVRSDALGAATELLRIVATEAHLGEADTTDEKGLLLQDVRRLRDDMFQHPVNLALGAAFPHDAYGCPAVGTPDGVEVQTPDSVRHWYTGRLRRGRLTIAAVGDIEPDRAADQIASAFGDWSGDEQPPEMSPDFRFGAECRESRSKRQSAVALAFCGVSERSPDRAAVEVLCAIASGLGGRFSHEIRERKGLAYSVALMPWFGRHAGAVLAYVATAPPRLEEARELLLTEARRFATEPVGASELDQAIRYAVGSRAIRRQRNAGVLNELVRTQLAGNGLATWGTDGDALESVTVEDVRRVSEEIFAHEPAAGLVLGLAD